MLLTELEWGNPRNGRRRAGVEGSQCEVKSARAADRVDVRL
jgi:hypothetical protein